MYLVDIFSEIRKIHKDSVLWLVGDGELRPQIEEKIKQLGLINSVKIFGMVDNTGELYQAMDVMVMPSLFERAANDWRRSTGMRSAMCVF